MAKDFYAILALPRNATEEQVRRRFRELARERHPDRFQGSAKAEAERAFQEITQAFNVLTDPQRRRHHDVELVRPQESTGPDPRQLARVYLQLGIRAYREKNYFEAADNFDRATQADPHSAQAWHHLALACSRQPNWLSRAVPAVERACELEPMNAGYHKLAGRILVAAGDAERAELHYRAALEWGEDDPAVRQALQSLAAGGGGSGRRGLFGKAG
jgi:tetratricopeptide (TPR) repeat protein